MPIRTNVRVCTHIKVTGVRCGSPTLRGEQFCYFHQRMLRTVKGPDSRLHHVALLENEEAIQASLMEVVNALIRGTIELKRAELILRALNTAVRNIRRVHFDIHGSDSVKEVPDYADAPANAETADVKTAQVKTAHVGTAAQACPEPSRRGRPGDPEVPGRSDPSTKRIAAVDPTQPKPPVSDRSAQVPSIPLRASLQSRKQRAHSG